MFNGPIPEKLLAIPIFRCISSSAHKLLAHLNILVLNMTFLCLCLLYTRLTMVSRAIFVFFNDADEEGVYVFCTLSLACIGL